MTERHALAHQLEKLIAARPEHAVVRLFLPAGMRDTVSAFEAVVLELEQTLWHAREPQAAALKLQWWADELTRTLAGEPRHPLTHALPRGQGGTAPTQWLTTALALLDDASASNFEAQLAAAEAFYSPLSQLERVFLGTGAGSSAPRALSMLLRELGGIAAGQAAHRIVVPLQLLARHQLTRDELSHESGAREQLLRDQLGALGKAYAALPRSLDAGLPVRLRLRLERSLVSRLAGDVAPARALLVASQSVPLMTAWHAWREARGLR